MLEAPRDGTLIRLTLRDDSNFVGYYSTKWWGWVDYSDPCPLIRGDIAFRWWEPVTRVEVTQLSQSAQHELAEAMEEPAVVTQPRSAIVTTRRLRRR